MTRKHFRAIAQALRDSCAPPRVVQALADVLAGMNPRFSRAMFLAASACRMALPGTHGHIPTHKDEGTGLDCMPGTCPEWDETP